MGALVLDPHKGLDAAYDQAAADTYFTGSRRDLRRPSASEFTALVEDAAVPALAIKRAYAYRVLEWQTPPNRQQPMECHFCGTVWRDLHHHVRGRCPAAYARLLHAQALFFRHVPRELGACVRADGWIVSSTGHQRHGCTWDGLYHGADVPPGLLLTMPGLIYAGDGDGSASLPPATRKRVVRLVVGALADPVPDPTAVLALWASLPYTIAPPPTLPAQPYNVWIQRPDICQSWPLSLAAAYVVRGLPAWRVESARALHLPLPWEPEVHPGVPTVLLIADRTDLPWALDRLAQVAASAPAGGCALLTDAVPGGSSHCPPVPLRTQPLGPVWLQVGPGVTHHWALRDDGPEQ